MPNKQTNINEFIGKRIQEVRKEKGLKQEYIAEEIRVKRPNISKYETGEIAIPLDVLKKISKILDVSTDYLLGLTDCKTIKGNYRALCDNIGIDDTAAEILEEINFVYEGQYLIPTLNYLIKQEELPPNEELFEEKYSQIENSKLTDKEKQKLTKKVQSIYDRMYNRWKEKNCQPVLSNIDDYLKTKTEDENLCLMLSGELKKEEKDTNQLYIRKKISRQEIFDEVIMKEIIKCLKNAKEKYMKKK